MLPLSIKKKIEEFTKLDNIRDEGLTTPDRIERFDNIDYGSDDNCLLDIYRLKDVKRKQPVIVSVHGGGWYYGNKERYQYYCMDLALRGFIVVNFTYHLIPKYKYPYYFNDVVKAFKFVNDNENKYDFDLNKVYAVGDSAGAHMLAQYIIYGTNEEYRKIMNVDDTFFLKPKAIGLNCGIYHFENEKSILRKYGFKKETSLEDYFKIMNILPYINEEFPPTFILSSLGDFLLKQQPLLQEMLNKANVENQLNIYGNEENKLFHVFHCHIKEKNAIKANDEECEFFKKH